MESVFVPAHKRGIAIEPEGLGDVLDELALNVNRHSVHDSVRVAVLLNAVGRSSYGPLLIVIGLFSISPLTVVPGMTWAAAAVTLLLALQMALGMKRPWLPRSVLEFKVPRQSLFTLLDKARPSVERFDNAMVRPRFEFLITPPFVTLVALCVAAAALVTFPLSLIPFAPLAPGLAVVLFGLGITARDGLSLSLGMAATLATLWLAASPLLGLLPG